MKRFKTRQFRKERRDERRELSAFAQGQWNKRTQEEEARPRFNTHKLFNPPRVQPKSENQRRYLESIERNTVTFGLGPAGSGKTFLAVVKAVEMFQNEDVRKMIFVRPHLGLGKTMGFQPGDLVAKMSHYMRPIFDALQEFYTPEQVQKMMERDEIEIAALEFMRGRTLKHAVILLDEAQNGTYDELKAFLTRLGEGSKYVVTGDITKAANGRLEQSDLHYDEQGALEFYANRFYDLPGVGVVPMNVADCVRHPLVKLMLERGF